MAQLDDDNVENLGAVVVGVTENQDGVRTPAEEEYHEHDEEGLGQFDFFPSLGVHHRLHVRPLRWFLTSVSGIVLGELREGFLGGAHEEKDLQIAGEDDDERETNGEPAEEDGVEVSVTIIAARHRLHVEGMAAPRIPDEVWHFHDGGPHPETETDHYRLLPGEDLGVQVILT